MKLLKKQLLLRKRILRIRNKISGTSDCPRLSVSFSNKHIYVQFIDDASQRTLLHASTLGAEFRSESFRANVDSASKFGELVGSKVKDMPFGRVVFDRRGRRFHGCVKAFADGLRGSSGLIF